MLSIIITAIFLVINITLYVINNNYLVSKVKEDNEAFLQITTHIINENEVSVALEYVEHYTHIHEVEIEIMDKDQNMLFSSEVSHRYSNQYQISTSKGVYTIFIDNTDSVTVNAIEENTIYVNLSLLAIYLLALVILLRNNRISSNQIDQDISNVLVLIKNEREKSSDFNYLEFQQIHSMITQYLENIDLLTEQKEMNMKGLAHDIKTPLTVVYSYFERIQNNQVLSKTDIQTAFDSAKRVNELLNDIIDNKKREIQKEINLSSILNEKLNEYKPIFNNKSISIEVDIDNEIKFKWSEKDYVRVIDNIISNAYYYSKHSSVFKVVIRKSKQIILEFTSEPSILSDIDTENLFRKGHRGSNSAIANTYGKGYGLYLCRLLLGGVDGEITVEILNKNVKFTIFL